MGRDGAVAGRLVVVGGLDPTGGAGLLRDGWTARVRAPELELRAVATALTRQGRGRPATVVASDAERLRAELERVVELPELRAVKLGLIPAGRTGLIADWLGALRARPRRVPVVLDPVLAASDGGRIGAGARELLSVAARVDLVTPNQDELEAFGRPALATWPRAVLEKGERLPGWPPRLRDRLRLADGSQQIFERPCVEGPDPRGTGCALATAVACELARGRGLVTAVAAAVAWLDGARRRLAPGPDGRWHLR